MSAIRLPLLCAFAGGCLSSAVLFGLWRASSGVVAPAAKQSAAPNVQFVVALVPSFASAALAAPSAEQNGASEAPAPTSHTVDSAGPAPAGSAVSDVLMNLEAAYRARVADPAPALPTERALAAASSDNATASPPAAAPPQPVAAVIPVAPPAPAAVTPAAPPPQIAAAPALVAQEDARPSEVHMGDVNQNTYVTNVRQGDVYVQLQQLQVLQYMQLLGMSSGLAAPTARHGRGAGARSVPFSSTITNPDNPWGFHFSPPNLVH